MFIDETDTDTEIGQEADSLLLFIDSAAFSNMSETKRMRKGVSVAARKDTKLSGG